MIKEICFVFIYSSNQHTWIKDLIEENLLSSLYYINCFSVLLQECDFSSVDDFKMGSKQSTSWNEEESSIFLIKTWLLLSKDRRGQAVSSLSTE